MTQHYIGVKQVMAWPEEKDGQPGYAVKYKDGYTSWSPQAVFEKHYLPMGEENDGSKITPEMVKAFIAGDEAHTMGAKTTALVTRLRNNFELVESSSCVDPANYDFMLGRNICRDRTLDQVWKLLGFLLQAARNGFDHSEPQSPDDSTPRRDTVPGAQS